MNSFQSFNTDYFYGNVAQTQPNFSADELINFDSSVFLYDSENDSISTLQSASKKIAKNSPAVQAKQASYKKSKRARNPWTPKEDAKLMDLMKKYGQSWAMISSQLEGRTGKQVRDRYLNKLRPNIKLGDWSVQEDELVVKLLKEVGNRWSLIANHLTGRTEGQVKNRFYSFIKKRLQPDGTLCQISDSRTSSEEYASFTTSPQAENGFDFGYEFDVNAANGSAINFVPQSFNCAITKGAYVTEEEVYSERSTSQGSNSQVGSSPLRGEVDPTDVISYDLPEAFFYKQPSQHRPLNVAPIEHDGQVDAILTNVTSYFACEVDSFFTQEGKAQESNDRLSQLSMRKAYLELALAKTLNEMKSL
jgi:hypothetical protein